MVNYCKIVFMSLQTQETHVPSKDDVIITAVEGLISLYASGKLPPFGLANYSLQAGEYWPVRSFDPRDPYGHLGSAISRTMDIVLEHAYSEFHQPIPGVRSLKENAFTGNMIMAYLLATIQKVANRDIPGETLNPSELAAIAVESYGPLIKKFASRDKRSGNDVLQGSLKQKPRRFDVFSRLDFRNALPLSENPFDDSKFRLFDDRGRLYVANAVIESSDVVSGIICPSGAIKLDSKETALKMVWKRMIAIAEEAHYTDPSAIAWASK